MFEERNIKVIPVDVGARMLVEELVPISSLRMSRWWSGRLLLTLPVKWMQNCASTRSGAS
jgi:hypothetical protein